MKIGLISDIHHEFYHDESLYENKEDIDVLVIAGDMVPGATKAIAALQRFAENHGTLIYVPGNHEYYGTSINEFDDKLREFSQRNGNIHFLNPGFVKLGDVTFIGAALWTNFAGDPASKLASQYSISDFRYIKKFTTDDAENMFHEHKKFFESSYRIMEGKKIFISHWLPARQCIAEQWCKPQHMTLNDYFANNLGDWIDGLRDSTWFFGHTHDQVHVNIGETICHANPYGYYRNATYKKMVLEIE